MSFSLKSLLFFRSSGWSGIDMQGGIFGVNVGEPAVAGGKPRVLQHVVFPSQTSDAPVLSQMWRTLAPAKFSVVSLLGRRDYQLFMLDKPVAQPDEMEASLRLTISAMIDYPVAEASLAWLDIPVKQTMGSRVQQLYVVVARTEVVRARKNVFDQANVRLDAVDIRETAQRNISRLMETDRAAACLICVEPEGVQLTVTFNDELYLVRFISESLLSHEGARGVESLGQAVERLALEIQRSFDFVRRNFPALNIETLHVAPTEEDLGLVAMLKTHLIEEVKPLDLSDVLDLSGVADLRTPRVQALCFHALGSALRSIGKD